MTLSTHIVVKEPVPVEPLFRFCQSLLGDPDAQEWRWEENWPGRNPAYVNRSGQGLDAWLIVSYGADGPLVRWDEDDDWPRGCIDVNFDTGYGYRADNGAGCGDLHAWLVEQVGLWLEERGVSYEWNDEFSGKWFDSLVYTDVLGRSDVGALR